MAKSKAFTNMRMIDFKEFLHLILLHISESSALQEGAFVLTVDLYLRCLK